VRSSGCLFNGTMSDSSTAPSGGDIYQRQVTLHKTLL
jgi:hypothetical protein